MRTSGGTSVMARRHEALDSLDYFPTPPWATRALFEIIGEDGRDLVCWEPACGQGHMADVLREYFGAVIASDVHEYGHGDVASFVGSGADVAAPINPDWIITNPPFRLAVEFAQRALREASKGVALLVRTAWLEGGARYDGLFGPSPPHTVAQFAERVPMCKGRWDPAGSTATAYCWVIWVRGHSADTRFTWIPPGAKLRHTRGDDVALYAGRAA